MGSRVVLAEVVKTSLIFNLVPLHWNWEQASLCVCSSTVKSVLTALSKPYWFANQLRGLTFLVSDLRDGVTSMGLVPLTH